MTRWEQYQRHGVERWEHGYRIDMQSYAVGLSDRLLELDSSNADSWDFGLRNQVQILSDELRQFVAEEETVRPFLEAMDEHGKKAYEYARALVSYLGPKQ